jgi:hypothetical protein
MGKSKLKWQTKSKSVNKLPTNVDACKAAGSNAVTSAANHMFKMKQQQQMHNNVDFFPHKYIAKLIFLCSMRTSRAKRKRN